MRANADTGEDAARARRFGAQGIGLCRTEHMFLGDRRATVERLVLATTDEEREASLAELLPLQRDDFIEIFTEMVGRGRHDPAARPAAARVPAELHRSLGQGRPGARPRRAHRQGREAARGGAPAARGEPDARAARRAAGHRGQGAVRDAGPGDRPGGRRGPPARARSAAADHDPADRLGAGAAPCGRGDLRGAGGGGRARGCRAGRHGRHDDRAAAGRADGRAHRGGRGVLLLRHERPHADDVGLLPRRRGGGLLLPVPGARDLRGIAVPDDRPPRRRQSRQDRLRAGPLGAPGPGAGRLRRARRRPRVGALLPRGRAGLRVLLAVPGAGRAPGGGPGGGGRRGRRRHR